jgi:hypothetical protein
MVIGFKGDLSVIQRGLIISRCMDAFSINIYNIAVKTRLIRSI